MKNLIHKIGLGVVASLVISGSLSNILIANADSIKSPQQINNVGINLDNQGDAQIIKGSKNIYHYGILGYYVSSADKRKIDKYIDELIEWFPEDKNKLENISHIFGDAKAFLEHLRGNGMEEGIQRVVIGDADVILMFREDIKRGIDWNEHSKEWIYNDGQNIDGIDDI